MGNLRSVKEILNKLNNAEAYEIKNTFYNLENEFYNNKMNFEEYFQVIDDNLEILEPAIFKQPDFVIVSYTWKKKIETLSKLSKYWFYFQNDEVNINVKNIDTVNKIKGFYSIKMLNKALKDFENDHFFTIASLIELNELNIIDGKLFELYFNFQNDLIVKNLILNNRWGDVNFISEISKPLINLLLLIDPSDDIEVTRKVLNIELPKIEFALSKFAKQLFVGLDIENKIIRNKLHFDGILRKRLVKNGPVRLLLNVLIFLDYYQNMIMPNLYDFLLIEFDEHYILGNVHKSPELENNIGNKYFMTEELSNLLTTELPYCGSSNDCLAQLKGNKCLFHVLVDFYIINKEFDNFKFFLYLKNSIAQINVTYVDSRESRIIDRFYDYFQSYWSDVERFTK